MKNIEQLSPLEQQFANNYGKGTVIESYVTEIIRPSQILVSFYDGFIGRLSILDMSWCLPEAEEMFRKIEVGDPLTCVVLDIDFKHKQAILSQKHLVKPLSDTIAWERIERGDEFEAYLVRELSDFFLVKTSQGIFGLLHTSQAESLDEKIKVKVNVKLDHNNLVSFVSASTELNEEQNVLNAENNEFRHIEEDLQSFYKFKKSLLGASATDKICEIVKQGFDIDNRIFSKEISTGHRLYVQFELQSYPYEVMFKHQAIPFFLDGATYSPENEQKLLQKLSDEHYWFKINKRQNSREKKASSDEVEFSLFNELINFHGDVQISKDQKEYRFVVRNFSIGHVAAQATEAKKRNAKSGCYLFSNPLTILSPYGTIPIGNSQRQFFEHSTIKNMCHDTVDALKIQAGEILRQEGKTLAIIDKFLEYQLSLIDEQKENNVFVSKFDRISSSMGGVSISLSNDIVNSLEIEEETFVNIRLKKDDDLIKLTDGILIRAENGCSINFSKDVNLNLLKDGFYIDKRIPKRQFQIQREIIQDFLAKKIKIDHIESLLIHPELIKTPTLSRVHFYNNDLELTEREFPDNNQVKAVKKAVGNQNVFLIQGPPGTGKTTVIAEIIEQLVAKGEKILVAGQNHVAVDNVLEKISRLHHLNVLRVGNPERVAKELAKYTIDNLVEEYKLDYQIFIDNQLLLSRKYIELREATQGNELILEEYNNLVNTLSDSYSKLKDIYKQRHFVLRDALVDLNNAEIAASIKSLKNWIESSKNEYEILIRPLIYNSVDVVFATCIGIRTDQLFRNTNFKFDTVIIDEAGKASIAETLVAIELGKKIILVGDQMQLPPYMDSSLIDENEPGSFPKSIFGAGFEQNEIVHALKTSFFEFIINRINVGKFPEANKELLNYQHRMHPNIGEFVSDSFYGGLVQMGSRTHLNTLDIPSPFNKEIVFLDTSNSENPYEQNDGYSAKNNTEAEVISETVLPRLFEYNISPSRIAVIAPYKSQVSNIYEYIKKSTVCNFKNIDVSTLDSFQGKEYDIIIFSFTRSTNHKMAPIVNGKKKFSKVGFLDDARRLNVAFSRAKMKLILVGNSVTLTDPKSHYDGLFNYTNLFRSLVKHSRNEKIGRFVNIAHLNETKSPFERFSERYQENQIIFGKVNTIGKKDGRIFGLFITIDKFNCLLPLSLMPLVFRENLHTMTKDDEIEVRIKKIDSINRKVTLELPVQSVPQKHLHSKQMSITNTRNFTKIKPGKT